MNRAKKGAPHPQTHGKGLAACWRGAPAQPPHCFCCWSRLLLQMPSDTSPPAPGSLSVDLKKRSLGKGFFGGEGFIMQRLSGSGMAFLECDGSLVKYELAAGQTLLVDTGNVLGFTGGVNMEIERIKGAKNVMFGGEGLFNTKLTGPGTIYLQTMPLANVADVIAAHLPTQS